MIETMKKRVLIVGEYSINRACYKTLIGDLVPDVIFEEFGRGIDLAKWLEGHPAL